MLDIKPIIFDCAKLLEKKGLLELFRLKNITIIDNYESQLEELYLVRNPKLKLQPVQAKFEIAKFLKIKTKEKPLFEQGKWVYFSWNYTLVHILSEDEFFELSTSRNHNLMTVGEQEILRNAHIGIGGLSVGNSIALGLALEGAQVFRLADFDTLSLSNLNRIRAGIHQLTLPKALICARQIYELNPYAKINLFSQGLKDMKGVKRFISKPNLLNVFVDEMDDVGIKIQIRLMARKFGIPVVSAADNGDGAIIDVERFDLEPDREIFHGSLRNIDLETVGKMEFSDRIKLINKMVGIQYVVPRMKESLLEVGKTLYAWPQLGGAAFISAGALAYAIKEILLGRKLLSGKYDVKLERVFVPEYDSAKAKKTRNEETKRFLEKQELIFSKTA